MENDMELISKVKEEIKKLKLDIIERLDKIDELVEIMDDSKDDF